MKYLGVFVTAKLNWSDHCKYCAHKATVCFNHLRRIMFGASFSAKNIAYKCLVRPILNMPVLFGLPLLLLTLN